MGFVAAQVLSRMARDGRNGAGVRAFSSEPIGGRPRVTTGEAAAPGLSKRYTQGFADYARRGGELRKVLSGIRIRDFGPSAKKIKDA